MTFDQAEYDLRFEWGERGMAVLAPVSQVVILIDVLSFSTGVSIAVERGAWVYPYRGDLERAGEFAASAQAELAGSRRLKGNTSLSPESLLRVQPGVRLVLPSLNGSSLALAAGKTPVLAGCLRNARAVARAAQQLGRRIAVIAAGERWKDDGSPRPCIEDLIGAGAVIHYLRGCRSPEAAVAVAAFREARQALGERLARCSSGAELSERGFREDVRLAAQLNVSQAAPILIEGAFGNLESWGKTLLR